VRAVFGRTSPRQAACWTATIAFLVVLAVDELVEIRSASLLASDFKVTLWEPARAVVHGTDPYANPGSVYPPSAFVPLVLLGVLPFGAAATVWTLLSLGAAAATLAVLRIRDWRCYALWLLNAAVLSTAVTGNATVVVGLLLALTLRYRDSLAGPAALAAGIATKLFVAPLILWFAFTGRARGALLTAAAAALLIFTGWAVLGFRGVSHYPEQLRANNERFSGDTPLLQGLVHQVGGSHALAAVVGICTAAVLIGLAWHVRQDDVAAFTLILAAAIAASPIAWVGYATLLVVPLAARTARFTPPWLLLLGFGYLHWWNGPLFFKSAALSVATIALTAGLVYFACVAAETNEPDGKRQARWWFADEIRPVQDTASLDRATSSSSPSRRPETSVPMKQATGRPTGPRTDHSPRGNAQGTLPT